MPHPPNETAARQWRGRFFEDMEIGAVYRSRLGRTVEQTDNTWFTLLTNNTNQVHFNDEFAAATEFGRPLVNSCLTLSIVVGLSVADTSENAMANLGWDSISMPKPVFAGDTLVTIAARPGDHRHPHPRHQPARRNGDRVPAHLHDVPAHRRRGRQPLPRAPRGLDRARLARPHHRRPFAHRNE